MYSGYRKIKNGSFRKNFVNKFLLTRSFYRTNNFLQYFQFHWLASAYKLSKNVLCKALFRKKNRILVSTDVKDLKIQNALKTRKYAIIHENTF